ncbi:MAG TPA: UvrD-helicase domain-containing protein [Steroidobacteraceae bacterium]|nr:UvrD-helicase domain-containing protein [Steroidobacteraceae bacterium]
MSKSPGAICNDTQERVGPRGSGGEAQDGPSTGAPGTHIDPAAADRQARERAIDPGLSVLLQAPAGSGKTSVLTQRLLRLLAVVEEPEEILAITFTRRAAAEMRARVLRALRAETSDDAQGRHLRELAAAALQRSQLRGWRLAEDPGRLRIQTIDSFNFRLASQLPVTAHAGGELVLSTRPQELYQLAARETLFAAEADPELAADLELLFERLDNRWSHVERMLADMLRERAHWLRHVLGHDPEVLCRRVGSSLAQIVDDELSRVCRSLGADFCAAAACLPGVGSLGAQARCLQSWKALARLALTDKGRGHWRRKIDRGLGAGYEVPAAKEALRACIERLAAMPSARETLLDVLALPSPELGAADAAALAALSRVLRSAAVQLQARFALEGRVDHTYVAGAARAALAEEGLPTDLALRTGLSLRHILVDEFQDTSVAQLDLLETLTAGWEPGDGRTLFVVGDPMQSIYQFREAEVGCFLRARDSGIGTIRLTPLLLLRNFRSTPALIRWTNAAFGQLFPRADDLRESAVAFTSSLGSPDDEASPVGAGARAVELRLLPDRAAETETIVARVKDLKKSDGQASIAILVAARSHAHTVIAALHAANIDAIGVELVPLGEVPVVRDLVALTRALCHLGDRTAWLAVLRAPWCGASLATLTALSSRGDSRLLCQALSEPERLEDASAEERSRIERVRQVLEEGVAQRDRLPLADWLEGVWIALGAADAYPAAELRHARAFFDALSERTASGEWRGIATLDSVLADLYAQPRARTARPVQVLTIHGAKGLEFDHVIVPGLDRDLNRGREPLLRWLDLPRRHEGSDLIMAPAPVIGDEEPGEVNTFLKRLMAGRAGHEQVRLLYVAATRARHSLHLYAAPKPRADGLVVPRPRTLLGRLWSALAPDFLESLSATAADETDGVPDIQRPALRRLGPGWMPRRLPPTPPLTRLPLAQRSLEPPEFSWVGETARHIGTVVHAALQALGAAAELPPRTWVESRAGLYREQLRRHGVPERDLERAAAVVLEALARTLADDRGGWILSREHREAASELALTGIVAGRLTSVVVDRSFVDTQGTRWVIDFKTSRHEGGRLEQFLDEELRRYRGQLETYAALARGLGPQPVRAALYFPLLGAFRESH